MLSQDPSSGTQTIAWTYTVPSSDQAYTSLSFKPPVWTSTDADCNINSIEVFSDAALSAPFTADPAGPITVMSIDNAVYPPQMILTFKTDTAFHQSLHFRGSSGAKNVSTEVYLVVCGAEGFSPSKDSFLVLDKIEETDTSFYWNVTSALQGAINAAW